MTPAEILKQLDSLNPDDHQISSALALLRLVVQNNPDKTAEQLLARRDVREAVDAIKNWMDSIKETVDAIASELPRAVARTMRADTSKTLEKLAEETDFNQDRIGEWKEDSVEADTWAARIILRMQWLLEWLRKQTEWMALKSPYKKWTSRLAENTCKYCRALHGTIIPIGKSFAVEARKAGFTRVYGGLYGPPLHPNCKCWLTPAEAPE